MDYELADNVKKNKKAFSTVHVTENKPYVGFEFLKGFKYYSIHKCVHMLKCFAQVLKSNCTLVFIFLCFLLPQ